MSLLPPRGLDASMPATLPFPMAQDSDVIRFSEVRAEVEGVPIAIQIWLEPTQPGQPQMPFLDGKTLHVKVISRPTYSRSNAVS